MKFILAKMCVFNELHILTILVIAGIGAKLLGVPLIAQLLGGGKP